MRGEGSVCVREFPLEPTLWVRIELAGYVNVVGTNTVWDIQETRVYVYVSVHVCASVCVCVCVCVCMRPWVLRIKQYV